MAEHDQRFKTLVREFFRELIQLFFPKWAAGLDFARLAQRRMLKRLIEKRFGPLTPEVASRIDTWPSEQLDAAILAVLDAPSLEELGRVENAGA